MSTSNDSKQTFRLVQMYQFMKLHVLPDKARHMLFYSDSNTLSDYVCATCK